MKVMIAAAQYSSQLSGLQRHAFNLTRCLLKQADISEIQFVVAPWQQRLLHDAGLASMERVSLHIAEMGRGVWARNQWYYWGLPKLVSDLRPDIVHLSYPVPVDRSSIDRPVVLTLHDLYPYEIPENFGFPKVLFNRAILQQCMRASDAIACVSDTTLASMKRYTPQSNCKKASRIYNCVEPEPDCAEQSPLENVNGAPFLLSISQHRRNKNISLLLHAVHRLAQESRVASNLQLVVVGIAGPETHNLERLVDKLQLNGRVHFVRGLSEPQLQWCYRNCEVLVAPSEREGFGLPVAEALLAGCRIVCSNIPAFHEIHETHCEFVDLKGDAVENFAHAIQLSLGRPIPLPLPLPKFSSSVLGPQYARLYRSLLHTQQSHAAKKQERSIGRRILEGLSERYARKKEIIP